jgi:hypothetical protein
VSGSAGLSPHGDGLAARFSVNTGALAVSVVTYSHGRTVNAPSLVSFEF